MGIGKDKKKNRSGTIEFAAAGKPSGRAPRGSLKDVEAVKQYLEGRIKVKSENFASRSAAFRAAKRDLGIPMSQRPDRIDHVPMTQKNGKPVIDEVGNPVMTREYDFTVGSREVVIQDHSFGHSWGKNVPGNVPAHINVRPVDSLGNTVMNGSIPNTLSHYRWELTE